MDFRLFPSRMVASGTITLAALGIETFYGSNNRQKRRQFIITNLDAANPLKLRTDSGRPFGTVFPQTCFTFEVESDIQVYNPSASASVAFEVAEIFYDAGTLGSPTSAVPTSGGGSSGGGGGLSNSSFSGSTGGLVRER